MKSWGGFGREMGEAGEYRALDDAESREALDDVLELLVRDAEGGCEGAGVRDLGVGVEVGEEAGLHVRRRQPRRHGSGRSGLRQVPSGAGERGRRAILRRRRWLAAVCSGDGRRKGKR